MENKVASDGVVLPIEVCLSPSSSSVRATTSWGWRRLRVELHQRELLRHLRWFPRLRWGRQREVRFPSLRKGGIFGCSWRRAPCLRCGSSLQRWTRCLVAGEAGGGGLCVFFFSSCSGRRSRSTSRMCAGSPGHWLLRQFQGFEAALGGRRWTMPGSGEQRRQPVFL